MEEDRHVQYLDITPSDIRWGLCVTSVGRQVIGPQQPYPPQSHPTRYLFSPQRGRTMNEYQILYITRGKGWFSSQTLGRDSKTEVREGTMILLFPGEWHNYSPYPGIGWDEYWIGAQGSMLEHWEEIGFISRQKPLLKVGIREDVAKLYQEAINIARKKESGYQQYLGGITCRLQSIGVFFDRNFYYTENTIQEIISKARIIINENIHITPEEVADQLYMSYSKFRRIFKEYTGFSPGHYIQKSRIDRAKEYLTNSGLSIKEIAMELDFENQDYFFTVFRRNTGMRPTEYRTFTRGEQENL